MKLFPRMELAVKAMALCCENEEDGKARCGDVEKSPIARSEVFNETWMLRLTLAALHDYGEGFCHLDGKKNDALKRIQEAVRKRWISEGGLEPAFEKEGTTWTDAILGDVRLSGETATDNKIKKTDGSKRKVELSNTSDKNPGVVVVEAKMGSPLDKSVTNSKEYDQVARNIASLAKLLLKANNYRAYMENSGFVVFMPDPEKCLNRLPELGPDKKKRLGDMLTERKNAAQCFFDGVKDKIMNEKKRRAHAFNNKEKEEPLFEEIVEKIARDPNSEILTWDEIIDAIAEENENKETLENFYIQALKEIIPKKRNRR